MRQLLRSSVPLSLYLLLAVASFYPQSLHPWDTVAYIGDSMESVYLVAWNVHQFFRDPRHLFDANILYPNRQVLAFTDHRLLPSVLVAPVIWATGNPVLAYNLALALGLLLAAMAGRHLARSLGLDPVGAWAAGALYAFHTYQVNEGPRLNVVFHGFLPLAVAELVRFLKTGERRHAWTTAGLMLLQGLSSNYHMLYGCLVLGLVTIGSLVARPAVTAGRAPSLALAAAAAALLWLPVALPYVNAARAPGYVRELPAGVDLEHYVSTTPTNVFYGPMGARVRLVERGPHFVGFFSLALAGLALGAWALSGGPESSPCTLLPARVWVPAAAAVALFLIVLSLGKDVVVFGHKLGPGPYRLLYDGVPGFGLVRYPERLALPAMLFVGLLAGRALTLLRAGNLRLPAMVLAAVIPLEHLSPLPLTEQVPVGGDVPAVYGWLSRNPVRAVAEVPTRGEGLVRMETVEMYFSTYHFKPLIQGFAGYPPLLGNLLRRLAAEFPSEVSLDGFQRVGVDTVVVHHGRPEGRELYQRLPEAVATGRIVRVARFAGESARVYQGTVDEVYRIVPATPLPAAPFPRGHRLQNPRWRYRAKAGNPALATDGDLSTAWVVPDPLIGDEFFEGDLFFAVAFDRPVLVSGLVLRLRRDSAFPTRFRIIGRDLQGRRVRLARYDEAHTLQLLDRASADHRTAALGFDLGGRELTALSLLPEKGGTSFFGWSLPEFEVWVP